MFQVLLLLDIMGLGIEMYEIIFFNVKYANSFHVIMFHTSLFILIGGSPGIMQLFGKDQ